MKLTRNLTCITIECLPEPMFMRNSGAWIRTGETVKPMQRWNWEKLTSKATDIQSVLAGLLRGGSSDPSCEPSFEPTFGSEHSKTLKSGSVIVSCDVWCATTDISLWRANTSSFTILILSSLVALSHMKLSIVNGLNQLCCRPKSTCRPIVATQLLRDRTESLSVWSLSSSVIKRNLFSW